MNKMDELQQLLSKLKLSEDEPLALLSHHEGEGEQSARQVKGSTFWVIQASKWQQLSRQRRSTRMVVGHRMNCWIAFENPKRSCWFKWNRDCPFVIGEVVAALEAGIPIVPSLFKDVIWLCQTAAFLAARDFTSLGRKKDTPGYVWSWDN